MRNIKTLAFHRFRRRPAVGLLVDQTARAPGGRKDPGRKSRAAGRHSRDVRPVETKSVDPLNDPKGVLANRSVYFDYDSYVVRDDGKPVVENHSAYLTKNKPAKS
jgi:peptidoglycan-associated lipoprotein